MVQEKGTGCEADYEKEAFHEYSRIIYRFGKC